MDVIESARRRLIFRPNGETDARLALDFLEGLALARQKHMTPCLVAVAHAVNPCLLTLTCDQVPVVRLEGLARRWYGWRLDWRGWRFRTSAAWARLGGAVRREVGRELQRQMALKTLAGPLRERVRRWREMLAATEEEPRVALPYKRALLRAPLAVRLSPAFDAAARKQARSLGLKEGTPIVAIHARERGSNEARGTRDRSAGKRDDSVSDSCIDSYGAAVDHLVAKGFAVVRLGDPQMAPFRRPGVLDLATSAARTPELELYVLLRSRFLVCGESGPLGVSMLTGTPTVVVNATDPIGTFPVRADSAYILKRVIDLSSGQDLGLRGMLTEHYYRNFRNPTRFAYRDNPPEEILEAVKELDRDLETGWTESPGQRAYRALVSSTAEALRDRVRHVANRGPDGGFLGDGRLPRFFAERHF